MPAKLLKPHLLSLKNRLLFRQSGHSPGRYLAVVLLSLFMIASIYGGVYNFLLKIRLHPAYEPALPGKLLSMSLLAFFVLLVFSNTIAALGYFFSAKDMPLLLTAPVAGWRVFLARFSQTMVSSSWMFLLFMLPAIAAFHGALGLPWTFLAASMAVFLPFVVIPAAVGIGAIILFVNLIPPYRMRDVLVITAFVLVCGVLYFNPGSKAYLSTDEEKIASMIAFLKETDDPQPLWLPSRWASDVITSFLRPDALPVTPAAYLLFSSALGLLSFAYLLYELLFPRAWAISGQGSPTLTLRSSDARLRVERALVPCCPQFRAMLYKEARTFFRDTTQSLQLLMLLMLTFLYLYNFRALRAGPHLSQEVSAWWQVILAMANVSFGACVVSAIATRFVFPSVSLEGGAFNLIRSTPISVEKILTFKFYIWLLPMSALAVLLLVSGSWAIFGSFETVMVTALLAVVLSSGIVGLGVGVGAVYARFDWDNPAQVTASFGSLVFMLLALGLVILSIVPSALLFVLTSVPSFVEQLSRVDYFFLFSCSLLLIVVINFGAARHALIAGANRLREVE